MACGFGTNASEFESWSFSPSVCYCLCIKEDANYCNVLNTGWGKTPPASDNGKSGK